MKILLVGVGLIGGSFSLALKNKGFEFGGLSRSEKTLDTAKELGIISKKFYDLKAATAWADWIILSIPVDAIKKMLPNILDQIADKQVVIDFGSTKAAICKAVKNHPKRNQFIAAHPIAGTEYSGPTAAFPDLYKGKRLIICEDQLSKPDELERFVSLATEIGFEITKMGAEEHDRHLAYISHLSHVTSYALSSTVLEKERNGEVILELSGSGFASTVRLAKSSPEMWSPIFIENKEMILEGIDNYMEHMRRLKELIEEENETGLKTFLTEAREIRKILK
ncbi:MAG: prephenate dehydrogenase [Cyclobacteriaceae bacterium]